MRYEVQNEVIETTGCLLKGKVNDVFTAVTVRGEEKRRYLLLVVKDRDISKRLAALLTRTDKKLFIPFGEGENYCLLAPFRENRRAAAYMETMAATAEERLEKCREILSTAVSVTAESGLTFPILYLILKERRIHLGEKGEIYFTCDIDLSGLDEKKNEADCAAECGYIIGEFVEGKQFAGLARVRVIRAKNRRGGYRSFQELQEDMNSSELAGEMTNQVGRIKKFLLKHQKKLLTILVVLSIIAIILAVTEAVSDTFLRRGSFDIIGTENLGNP